MEVCAMRIIVLGCNASITGNLRTTCYQVDDDVLIDAGTGAGDLGLNQAIAIDTIFLTHSHLDHCCLLPMLVDTACSFRDKPLTVYALPETVTTLRENMFNGRLWPDYTVQPSPEQPYLHFEPISIGETIAINGRKFTALPTRHSIPCIGYRVDNGENSWVYSGDTTLCRDFWEALNLMDNLRYLLIEITFLSSNSVAAERSGHMTAELLVQGLHLLQRSVELYIVHMEAGSEDDIMREILVAAGKFRPISLQRGESFEL
jgi:ribonuclease BN (tRNA processing enzyme)